MVRSRSREQLLLLALAVSAHFAAGCSTGRLPRIDPTGERLLVAAPVAFVPEPGPPRRTHGLAIVVAPSKVVAPVGSEVVMLAGVCGPDGHLAANQRVEWLLAPGGVGQFVALGKRTPLDWLVGFGNWPRKVDNTFAVGTTSSRYLTLTRGTPSPDDDIAVLRGQAWLTVTSPIEGTSYVTAYAPSVYGWDSRQQTSTIHWIDAEWAFPPPAINPPGARHVFTTTVSRHGNHTPLAGWPVRYEITGGPAAGFAPDGAQVAQQTTDALGQASVEIFQAEPAPGTNTITIQVIRPAEYDAAAGERLVVGTGATQKTWSSPGIALTVATLDVAMTGPTQAEVGTEVTFDVSVTNRGDAPARGLVAVDRFDAGLEHAASASPIERALGDLEPGQSHRLSVTFRVTQVGKLCNTVEIHATGGFEAQAQACVTAIEAARAATAQRPALTVKTTGPARRSVGETAEFVIEITNSGRAAATNLRIADHYDVTLDPIRATEGYAFVGDDLVWSWNTLAAGKTIRFEVHCRCQDSAAKSCNRVTVTSDQGARADDETCLEIAPAEGALALAIADLRDPVEVGRETTYEVRVTNNGRQPDQRVTVAVTVPSEMRPLEAGTSGPARWQVDGKQVRFEPVKEIRAGETLTYRIRVRADRAGSGRCRAELASENLQQAVSAEENTTIFANPP